MFLYIDTQRTSSSELFKAVKPPKMPSMPSVGGSNAPSGGSGQPQSVDCPLGADCPDKSKKHRFGSKRLEEHTKAAQSRGAAKAPSETKEPAKDVPSTPAELDTPEAQNLGSLGSDKAPKPEMVKEKAEEAPAEAKAEEAAPEAPAETTSVEPTPEVKQPAAKRKSKKITEKYDAAHEKAIKTSIGAHTGETSHEEAAAAHLEAAAQASAGSKVQKRHLQYAEMHMNGQNPYQSEINRATIGEGKTEIAPPAEDTAATQIEPPAEDTAATQIEPTKDTQPSADEVADDFLGTTQVEPTKETETAEDTAATQIEPTDGDREEPEAAGTERTPSAQEQLSDAAQKQRDRAKNLLKEAKEKHEQTAEKAKLIKESNQQKINDYKAAQEKYEADKASKKKNLKKPQKPKLDKEIDVPEKPELREPSTDAEKLRHADHTSRAKQLASDAEAHLLHNENLSDSDRKKLEHAHAIGAFNSSVEHTPSAAMRAEVAEAQRVVSKLGKPPQPKVEPEEMELTEDDIEDITGKTEISPPPEGTVEDEPADSKTKTEISPPPEDMTGAKPSTDMEHLRVKSHVDKASSLRDNIYSHLESNPDLSDSDMERAQMVLEALERHHDLDTVPTKEQAQELSELSRHAGSLGKEFKAKKEKGEKTRDSREALSAFNYLVGKMREGASRGQAIGRAAVSPGGAGATATQTLGYGVSGAVGVGHSLLSAKNTGATSDEETKTDEESTESEQSDSNLDAADLSAERSSESSQNSEQQRWDSWKKQYESDVESGNAPEFPTGFERKDTAPADEAARSGSSSKEQTPEQEQGQATKKQQERNAWIKKYKADLEAGKVPEFPTGFKRMQTTPADAKASRAAALESAAKQVRQEKAAQREKVEAYWKNKKKELGISDESTKKSLYLLGFSRSNAATDINLATIHRAKQLLARHKDSSSRLY